MTKEHTCNRCKKTLPASEFHACKAKKSGLQNRCKVCDRLHHLEWKQKNPEKEEARRLAYKRNHPQKLRNAQLKYEYGIDYDTYQRMLQEQEGRCGICGKTAKENKAVLSVDHCHRAGHVRKLLCRNCNVGLGLYRDSPELLRKAADYLEEHNEPRQRSSGDGTTSSSTQESQRTARETEEVRTGSSP